MICCDVGLFSSIELHTWLSHQYGDLHPLILGSCFFTLEYLTIQVFLFEVQWVSIKAGILGICTSGRSLRRPIQGNSLNPPYRSPYPSHTDGNTGGTYWGCISESDCASLSRHSKSEIPGQISSDGPNRASDDPSCSLRCYKAKGILGGFLFPFLKLPCCIVCRSSACLFYFL